MNDKKPSDSLEELKLRLDKQIADTEIKLRTLKASRATIEDLEREARKGEMPQTVSDLGTTDAVLTAVAELRKRFPTEQLGFAVSAIKDWMLTHGFKPGGKEFDIGVSVTLQRLREGQRLSFKRIGNLYYYFPKE